MNEKLWQTRQHPLDEQYEYNVEVLDTLYAELKRADEWYGMTTMQTLWAQEVWGNHVFNLGNLLGWRADN